MRQRKKVIITNNREIYEKFNILYFSPEIILKDVKKIQIKKILDNINKENQILSMEKVGDYFLIKKIGHLNFNIYLR